MNAVEMMTGEVDECACISFRCVHDRVEQAVAVEFGEAADVEMRHGQAGDLVGGLVDVLAGLLEIDQRLAVAQQQLPNEAVGHRGRLLTTPGHLSEPEFVRALLLIYLRFDSSASFHGDALPFVSYPGWWAKQEDYRAVLGNLLAGGRHDVE